MKRLNLELIVGTFVVAGLLSFMYLSIRLGDVDPLGEDSYTVDARFSSIAGLKDGAVVEIAGVQVGKVNRIQLDKQEFEAVVSLTIDHDVKLQEDSIASIRSTGLLGDKIVNITPGGIEEFIEPGGEIVETESSVSIEELIGKYIFQNDE